LRKYMLAALLSLLLSVSAASSAASAHPGHERSDGPGQFSPHQHPEIDWASTPADIQALKAQLDRLRTEQRELFDQMRGQREQLKSAHQNLTEQKRQALKHNTEPLVKQMHETHDSIHSLRDQAHSTWHQFYDHSQIKQWDAAKRDLRAIISVKQQMIANQKIILQTQKRMVELMSK
jgi:chromosome segregation ATPase